MELRGVGLPNTLVDLLRAVHDGTTSRARHGYKLSSPFITTSGVRQGCVLAPALFCRAMDIIMSHVANVTGMNLDDIRLTDLNYADDAVLLTDDPSQLQPALHQSSGYMCPGSR